MELLHRFQIVARVQRAFQFHTCPVNNVFVVPVLAPLGVRV